MERSRIGRYEIHSLLGQGGMGTVYKGRDPLMDRWIAIKAIAVRDSHQRERFQQEVRAAGRLNHPHITLIYDVGEEGELAYIIMELVEGGTLASYLSPPVPWREAVNLLVPICQALAYAHERGVIHRDIKPSNILISTDGQVKLTDFGVARLEVALRRLTEPGSTVGTPLYTAPEQIRGEAVDGRADLFSLGIVLFELLTSRHPFAGESLAQVVYRITQPEPTDLEPLAELASPALVDVVGRVLNKDPADRFPNASEMAAALLACLEQPAPSLASHAFPAPPIVASSLSQHAPRPLLEVVSNISLSPAEETLLLGAFAGHECVYLEREFDIGYSGARVLLATPVRSGRRLAQVVIKLDQLEAIEREWLAYKEYVEDTLPPVTARILEEPHYAEDRKLALLRYTFAGGLGQAGPESLRTYYARHKSEEVASLLDKGLFRTFGHKWWMQRSAKDFILRREYDRLLPVHLMVKTCAPSEETPRSLVAGKISAYACEHMERGQSVQIQGFMVEEVKATLGEVTLQAPSFSGTLTDPIRVRVEVSDADQRVYRVGEIVPSLIGRVIATRRDLLQRLAESAFPGQDFSQKEILIGSGRYLNPLYDYDTLLDRRISAMVSIIHGDLNLENVLVTPPSGPVWLIDFATTREGHNLYDFIRLEADVITKLLSQTRLGPEAAIHLIQALHQPEPSAEQLSAELRKPFAVLAAIRQMARACLYSRQNWDEYYLGLTVALLGTMKFKQLDDRAQSMALAAAAAVRGLIDTSTLQVTPPSAVPARPLSRMWSKVAIGVVGLILFVAALGLGVWFFAPSLVPLGGESADRTGPPTLEAAPTLVTESAVAPEASTPPLTATPIFTSSPSPLSRVADGTVMGSLDIRGGPGPDYPVLGSIPEGNPVRVTGRSNDGKWWQIAHPGGPGGYGWVLAEFVELKATFTPPIARASPPPTATITPTATPTASLTPAGLPQVADGLQEDFATSTSPNITLEDFDTYSTATLRQTYSLNDAWGVNSLSIDVTALADAPQRGQMLSLTYQIDQAAPDNYVGLERKLPVAQNWSNFSSVQLWVRNDANPKDLIFQWGEADAGGGEVWKVRFPLLAGEIRFLQAPLSTEAFRRADWSPVGNAQMDLDQVNYYGFYIEQARPAAGIIYLDTLEFQSSPDKGSAQSGGQSLSAASCQRDAASEFEDVWNSHRSEMGCPLGELVVIPTLAEQIFEGGHLFWRSDTDNVYAIYDRRHDGTILSAGSWQMPPWKWDGSYPDGIGLLPPASRFEPKLGFGWLWRTHLGGPAGPLGWALDREYGFDGVGQVQEFEKGLAFKGSDPKVYALLKDRRFFAYDPALSRQPPSATSGYQDTNYRPASAFAPAWDALGQGAGLLGYPIGPPIADRNYAKQLFERGFMFWWDAPQEPQPVWVVTLPDPAANSGDTWGQYEDRWDPGQPEFPPDCPEAGPPLGPRCGFGWTWCYRSGVKESVGLPREAESGSGDVFPKGAVQFFQGGVMLENPADRQVWALVYGAGWHRFSY